MDEFGRLMQLCPPPQAPARAVKGIVDGGQWEIPGDYAELLKAYGPGSFDEFLWIYGEGAESVHQDLGSRTEMMRQILLRKVNPAFHEVLRENGGSADTIVQWAGTDNADSLLWITGGEPDQWPTIAVEAGALSFRVIAENATTILSELMDGSLELEFMPDDFPSAGAGFSGIM